mmetsp:Transcript_40282/g.96564  ORF Transcript_40282/g.96564 Transcript_40282/m.96564 type:complete len:341 (-) Transcript_40282:114-1136(-)
MVSPTVVGAATPWAEPAPRPACKFGAECYRANPSHRGDFAHPGDPDYADPANDAALAAALQHEELAEHDADAPRQSGSCCQHGFTVLVAVIELVVFAVELLRDTADNRSIGDAIQGVSANTLLILGGRSVEGIQDGEWWRLVTSMFLHVSIAHLAWNMFLRSVVLWMLERYLLGYRLLFVYWTAGIAGSLVSCLQTPTGIVVGASGAVSGLIGAQIVFLLEYRGVISSKITVAVVLSTVALVTAEAVWVEKAYEVGVDSWSHIGGFVAGACGQLSGFGSSTKYPPLRYPVARPRITNGPALVFVRVCATLWLCSGLLIMMIWVTEPWESAADSVSPASVI